MFWNLRLFPHLFLNTSEEVRANQRARGGILIGWNHSSNMAAQWCATVPAFTFI